MSDAADGRAEISVVCVITGDGGRRRASLAYGALCPFTFAVTPSYKLNVHLGAETDLGQTSSSLKYPDYLGQVKD